jgi:predicted P-loop ATPase
LLEEARDQLWAEAAHRFQEKEQWWIDKGSPLDEQAAAVQAERYTEDVWSADIERYLDSHETRLRGCVLTSEILSAIGVTTVFRDAAAEMRVTDHLTFLGWRKRRTERHGLNRNWWFPPGSIP